MFRITYFYWSTVNIATATKLITIMIVTEHGPSVDNQPQCTVIQITANLMRNALKHNGKMVRGFPARFQRSCRLQSPCAACLPVYAYFLAFCYFPNIKESLQNLTIPLQIHAHFSTCRYQSAFESVGFRRFFTNPNPSDLQTRFLSDSDLIFVLVQFGLQ